MTPTSPAVMPSTSTAIPSTSTVIPSTARDQVASSTPIARAEPTARGNSGGEPTWRRTALEWLLPVAGILLVLLIWWIDTTLLVPRGSFLSRFSPDRAASALVRLLSSGQLWPHLFTSFRRVGVGLAISAAIGIPLGLAVGSLPLLAKATGPTFQFTRMVSPLSWTPLAIILLGVGDRPVYFLIAIGCVWPIVLNTAAGVAALDPRWLTLARSLGATPWETLGTIVWPGIRAHVLTGLRLAVGLAWIILVPAEMLGVNSGLGYFALNTRDRLAYDDLMAAILIVGACGFAIDLIARRAFAAPRR